MPRTIEQTVYTFDELSDVAKERARDWYRRGDVDTLDSVVDDFQQIAEMVGLDLDMHTVKLYGGGTRQEPAIDYSVGFCQSDFAAFNGTWRYKKGCMQAVREYAPKDEKLHRIISDWREFQRQNFYQMAVKCGSSRDRQTLSDITNSTGQYVNQSVFSWAEDIITEMADWLYNRLRAEIEYQTSDEVVDETIRANKYEFFENGERV